MAFDRDKTIADANPVRPQAAFYSSHYRNRLPLANLVARCAWNLVYRLLFYPSPTIFFGWRRLLLRLFGARIDCSAKVYPTARIWAPWNLRMSAFAGMGPEVYCYNVAPVHLADETTVSFRAFLCTASHDIHNAERPLITGSITLERGAYVFADAFIGMNVTIHEGAVVAARAVVVKDVESFTVVGGNPSRVLGRRQAGEFTMPSMENSP
jgi:putative colanic acid biosynthesis acetyltransferase WcaF